MGMGKDLWNQLEALINKHDWPGVASLHATDGRRPGRTHRPSRRA
jgi:hypothetical protein